MKTLCSIAFGLAFICPGVSQANILFSAPTSYESGIAIRWVGVADFNEDGNEDLAVPELDSSRVVFLFGKGDGTLGLKLTLPLSSPAETGATGDLDGDGHVDLALSTPTGITILYGNGDGAFRPEHAVAASLQPYRLAIADLDHDAMSDLVFPDAGRAVHVLWNAGQETFAPESTYQTSPAGDYPDDIVITDLNGDGHLDLATSDYGHAVCCWHISVFLGSGTREFAPRQNYGALPDPVSISAGDLDNNGSLDLITVGDLGEITVLLNQGNGTFAPASVPGLGTDGVYSGRLSDLDLDGAPDFAATSVDSVFIERGLGGGHFALDDKLLLSYFATFLAPVDLDRDTRPDIITAGSGGITVFLNRTPAVGAGPPGLRFALEAPRPNPARRQVAFDFSLAESGRATFAIYDLAGRLVSTLVSGELAAGPHHVTWNLVTRDGRRVGPGVYFTRLSVMNRQLVRRVEVLP